MTDEVDPLSQAAGNLEAPKFPILKPERTIPMEIMSCKVAPSKSDETRSTMSIVLATTREETAADGKPLHKGFKGYTYIGLTPSEATDDSRGRSITQIAEELGMVLKACGKKSATPRELITNPSMIEREIVSVKIGKRKSTAEFPNESNTFTFVPPA